MTDKPMLQAGLGRETDLYKEGDNLTTLFLARVTNVNFKYNTVDVVTVGNYSSDAFLSAQGTDGKYSAKLPLEFGGTTNKGKIYGSTRPVEVNDLVLIGFVNGKKKTPIVIGIYADDTTAENLMRSEVNSTDKNNEEARVSSNSSYKLYPSLTYDNIDGNGNRAISFTGKTFFVATDADKGVANLYDNMHGSLYEGQKASYYQSGELIEPLSEKAPIILFKHQGITTDDGQPDKHVFMAFLDRDGTMRLTETDTEDTWRSFLGLSPDKSIGLYQHWNTNSLGEETEATSSHIAILPNGAVSLRSGTNEWTLKDSTILLDGQDAIESSLTKQMDSVSDLLQLYQTINDYTNYSTLIRRKINNAVKLNKANVLNFEQRLDLQDYYMQLQNSYSTYLQLAKKYDISSTPFENAYSTLKTYIDAVNFFSVPGNLAIDPDNVGDKFDNAFTQAVSLLTSIAEKGLGNLNSYQKGIYNVSAGMVQTNNSVGLVAEDLRVLDEKIEANSAELKVQAKAIEGTVKTTELPTIVGDLVKIGGTNYFYEPYVVHLGLSKNANLIIEGDQYKSWYIAVDPDDILSIKRWSTPNNEFSYVFTKDIPDKGIEYFGGNFNTTEANGTQYNNIIVPKDATYLFLYLSSQNDTLPKIKVEYGTVSTDYSEPTEAVKEALSQVTTRVGQLEVTSQKITLQVSKKVGLNESYGGVYVTDNGVSLQSTDYEFYLNDEEGFVFRVKNDPSKNLATAGDVNDAVADKAILIQSDTEPDQKENVLWVDTSLPDNPVKVWDESAKIWIRSKGEKGDQGIQGLQGETGEQGIPGKDGTTYYTHLAYANSGDGIVDFSVTDFADKSYLGMYVDTLPADSTKPTDYRWSLIKGEDGKQGIPGAKGEDGRTPYFHTAWANSADGTVDFNTSTAGNKRYMGTYTDFTQDDSEDPTRYTWLLTKGEQGIQGLQGEDGEQGIPGKDGATYYTHIAYADSANGTLNFSTTNSDRKYVGMYVDELVDDSTSPSKYNWSLIKGADGSQGIPGAKGEDGRTSYFHMAYANSADGLVDFSTTDATNKRYIGTYTDFTIDDTTEPSKYTWLLTKGEQGIQGLQGEDGEQGIPGESPYEVQLYSRNGLLFKNGIIQTVIDAVVYRGKDNITDSLDANQFKWTKILSDGTLDEDWNHRFAGGRKSITITGDDIYRRATFQCDIVEI